MDPPTIFTISALPSFPLPTHLIGGILPSQPPALTTSVGFDSWSGDDGLDSWSGDDGLGNGGLAKSSKRI
jgi:hypothetical protein